METNIETHKWTCAEECNTLEHSVINGMSLSNISLTKGGPFGAQETLCKSQQYVKGSGDGRHPGFHAHLTSILLIEPKIHLKSETINEYKSAFNLEGNV